VLAQAGKLGPVLAAVAGLEDGCVLNAGVDGVRIGERWLDVPDALEIPGVGRAVVPLVGAGRSVVGELVADRLPVLAGVVGTLDDLPMPVGRRRAIYAIGIGGRALEVIDLPAGEVRAADLPLLAFAV
jgi:hypothetical protein